MSLTSEDLQALRSEFVTKGDCVMFDGLAARIDALDRLSDRLDGHETRIGGLDRRVALLEGQHPKQ